MTDMELAEEIERMKREAGGRNQFALWLLTNVDEIIAALRRGPEPAIKDETFAEKVKRLQDARAQIDIELSRLL